MGVETLEGSTFDLTPYLNLLPQGQPMDMLDAILTTLAPEGELSGRTAWLTPQPLALTYEVIMNTGGPVDLGASLALDWGAVADDPIDHFETAAEIFRKHTWAVPGTRGEPGVSLYEEFKLLSALVHASGCAPEPAAEFTLVAGDFPGIQRTIYTITSKGAAKGLRGRSFFLQLLGDAVVRALLGELGLTTWLNVVYLAGGNFVLLAGPDAEGPVRERTNEINGRLLQSFWGDVSLVVGCQLIGAHELQGEAFLERWRGLKRALGEAKQRPFAAHAASAWQDVFAERGVGTDRHCVVCHREPEQSDLSFIETLDEDWRCDQCEGFEQLAQDLAHKRAYLSVAHKPSDKKPGKDWREQLRFLTGWWYDLHTEPPGNDQFFYRLNSTDFLEAGAAGFRFVATCTPLATEKDVALWKKRVQGDPEREREEPPPRPGETIRTFEDLAEAATGIKRVGILRMDVDNLGRVFGSYIHQPSLARISAASAAMSLFFDGWLNNICAEVKAERPNSLYVIYAGGDDLFIVGPWDLMPMLAQRIRGALVEYVNDNPNITISAGITLESAHFPLYQAAERARHALDNEAKGAWRGLDGGVHEKNAISLLGQVVGWEDGWPNVDQEMKRLRRLRAVGVPAALIQIVRQLHASYQIGRMREKPQDVVYFGRWMWMKFYTLSRLVRQHGEQVQREHPEINLASEVEALQENILSPYSIQLAGLAARWAEYLERESSEKEGT